MTSIPFHGHLAALAALVGLSCGCSPQAHPTDHEHAAVDGPEPVAVTAFGESLGLYLEYPRLTPGAEARFLAHLTVLATGEPVRSGRVAIELRTPAGASVSFTALQPTREGVFVPLVSLAEPGTYAASILVHGEQAQGSIALPPIVVHADLAAAHAAAQAEARSAPRDAVPFLLEQQWPIGLLLEPLGTRRLVRRLRVPAEVEAVRGGAAVVSAPLAGRLLAPGSGELPRIGQRVEQGQELALLELPLSTSDLAQLSANALNAQALEAELSIREFDLETRALDAERARFQAQARLDFANQALARLVTLRAKALGSEAELEAARRDVEIAQREQSAAQGLSESILQARRRLSESRARATDDARPTGLQALRVPLIAPIAGEVVAADRVEGEHVDAHATVYRLLALERVWIRAHVSEFDLAGLGQEPGALVELAAHPGRTWDVRRDLGGTLVGIGREVDPTTRTLPLRFEVANPDGLLRVGMFADVFLETAEVRDALALPREALVLEGGRTVAFVLLEGELFQKRVLELGIEDGPWVQVLSGLVAGERVVTRGAHSVKLAAASPALFGAGHAH